MIKTKRFCITYLDKLRDLSNGITFFRTDCVLLWKTHCCEEPKFWFMLEILNYKVIEIEYYSIK